MRERVELLLRILVDVWPPGGADGAYLFGQTQPNQESVFVAGRELVSQGQTRKLLISDCGPKSGYLGVAACRQALIVAGVPAGSIVEVPMEPTEVLHTLIESRKTVQFAKAQGYRRLLVVTTPVHQERAFITVVSVARREYPSLKIYSHPGAPQAWDESTIHSQGQLKGTRAELIAEECRRIETYITQGDLLPRAVILEYLRRRDHD